MPLSNLILPTLLISAFIPLSIVYDIWPKLDNLSSVGSFFAVNGVSLVLLLIMLFSNLHGIDELHTANHTIKEARSHVNFSELLFTQLIALVLVALSHAGIIVIFSFYPFIKDYLVMRYFAPLVSAVLLSKIIYRRENSNFLATLVVLFPMLYYVLRYI